MNLAHLHIVLNHFPTIGTVIGLALLVFAFYAEHDDLKRFSLGLFLVLGILVIPTYMSGEATAEIIAEREGISQAYIDTHRSAALVAYFFAALTAAAAWLGLWQYRQNGFFAKWNLPSVLILAILTVGLMINTGTAGGEISHVEIRPEGAAAPMEGGLAASIELAVITNPWIWPASEALHFIGMALLFGVVLVLNLRMLGIIKAIPFSTLHALLPWGMGAFALNLMTGMIFFIGAAGQYTQNLSFYLKVILIILAGFNVIYFTVFDQPWRVQADDNPPLTAKVMAASTIAIWFGIIYFGRMLPYIGNSF